MATADSKDDSTFQRKLIKDDATTDAIANTPIKLKKQLGLMNGVAIILGVIIGSGIFVSPRGVLEGTESMGLALLVWLMCGLLSMCGALCYAELGTMIPKSGGEFAYLNESYGGLFAFLYLWVALLIIMPTGNAIIAITFADYILKPFFLTCSPPEASNRLIAAAVILFLTFINCYNVKWAAKIQDIFAGAKLFALAIIIIAGIVYMGLGNVDNFHRPFDNSSYAPANIALAFYSGMFSFSGWNSLNFVTEELKKPMRDLPRAIYISLPLVTLVYLLTNISYFAVLSQYEILTSNTVAGSFGDKILGPVAWIIPLFVVMSTFGGLNGGIFASSRLFFVGAREGHLPVAVSMINIGHLTPAPSLIFLCLVTLLYLWAGHVFFLINLASFVEATFLTLTISALLWLRYKEPNRSRPIKVNIILPIIFLIVGILLVTLPFYEKPHETLLGLIITLSGIPAYFIFVYWQRKPLIISKLSDTVTRVIQKLLVCSPQDENDSESDTIIMDSVSSPDKDVVKTE